MNFKAFNSNKLQLSPVVHDSFSPEQIEKVTFIHRAFAEVQPGTLEETLADFMRDRNPDTEIAIWLNMAQAYSQFVKKKGPRFDVATKREAYKLLVLRSMQPEQEALAAAAPTLLSTEDVEGLLASYRQAPQPLKLQSKR